MASGQIFLKLLNPSMTSMLPEITFFKLIPGTHVKILFWKDVWCGSVPFQAKFPNLYQIESSKCFFLEDRLSRDKFSWSWIHVPANPLELNELLNLYIDIRNQCNITNSDFGFIFTLSYSGEYFVNMMRRLIETKIIQYSGPSICWEKTDSAKCEVFRLEGIIETNPCARYFVYQGLHHSFFIMLVMQ